ncbi:MAG: hypothetical protein ACREXT_12815, partial [Gammaproteobacteria bacterium]
SPTLVNGTLVNELIGQSATNADYYQLLSGTPTSGEYFLVENRQKVNYDASVPGSGLLIWHIDASKSGNTAECYPGGPSCATNHYKVAVVQADNLYNMEKNNNRGDAGDPWPGTSGKTVFDGASSPNSNYYNGSASGVSVTGISASGATMSATLSTSTVDTTPPDTTITSGPSGTITTNGASLTWTGSDNLTATANLLYAYRLDPIELTFSAFGSATSKSYSNLANRDYTFLVQARDQATNVDLSPASRTFTVNAATTASIQVTAPNGGEVWIINSRPTIRWNSSNVSGNVSIEVSRNGGTSWTTISSSTANDGAHTWRVSKPATNSAWIRVCSVANPALCDMSDGSFTIQ